MTDKIHEQSYQAGVEAERERIRSIFENQFAAELPGDAIRIALETDMCDAVAGFRLRAEAAKPEAERNGAKILPRERTGYSPDAEGAAPSRQAFVNAGAPLSPEQVAAVVNAETKAGASLADTSKAPSQKGAAPVDDIMLQVNSEAKRGAL